MSKFRLDRLSKKLERERQTILNQMANDAVVFFKTIPFETRSWEGKRWRKRKDKLKHPLLEKTRKMRMSIRKLRSGKEYRVVGSPVKYARYHNSGSSRLPIRQFIGDSRILNRHFIKLIHEGLKRV